MGFETLESVYYGNLQGYNKAVPMGFETLPLLCPLKGF